MGGVSGICMSSWVVAGISCNDNLFDADSDDIDTILQILHVNAPHTTRWS